MNVRNFISAFAITLSAVACSTNSNVDLSGEWAVVTISGVNVPETMKEPVLSFDTANNTYSGVTGINSINGGYTLENDNISFSDGPMTKMAGDPASMETENGYIKAIMSAKTISTNDGTLTLKDVEGNELMTLKKK